jgi:hypothetical protein
VALKNKNMKKILLFACAVVALASANAQCVADYDFGDVGFGVSPDPEMGESFEVGVIGVAYVDDIHILVPTQANDIDESIPAGIPIDSLQLESVELVLNDITYTLAEVGLSLECNNNGDSGLPCSFLGGNQYCAQLAGTPTLAGEFNLIINVIGWTNIFGPQSQAVAFDQYTLIINTDVSVSEIVSYTLDLGQNSPNPADVLTSIPFSVSSAGVVRLSVVNLLGEQLIQEQIQANKGQNSAKLDVGQLDSGIYLYSIETKGKKLTKRLVINR